MWLYRDGMGNISCQIQQRYLSLPVGVYWQVKNNRFLIQKCVWDRWVSAKCVVPTLHVYMWHLMYLCITWLTITLYKQHIINWAPTIKKAFCISYLPGYVSQVFVRHYMDEKYLFWGIAWELGKGGDILSAWGETVSAPPPPNK